MARSRPDLAHRRTDKALAKLERRITAEYQRAAGELQDKIDSYFERFRQRDAEQLARLQAGEITQQQYTQWRLAQIGRGQRFEALRDRIADRMTRANEVAAAYINDATPGLYALNRNYAAYSIEQQVGRDVGFALWDEQTVRRLVVERPDLMPYYPPARAVQRGIDLAWGKRQITAQVTSGILQGESIKHLADRLQTHIPDMSRTSAIRAARTAVTGAQNAGRLDSYHRAEEMGISLEKQWVATLDGRTRHDHAVADGQTVKEDAPFLVGGYELMYPGDPSGPGHLIYNCRCTMIAKVKGTDRSDALRRDQYGPLPDMTYAQWEASKRGEGYLQLADQRKPAIINARNMAMGLRRAPSHILTESEIASIKADAEAIGIDVSVLLFNDGIQTGFRDSSGLIYIRGDILPDTSSTMARDRMSQRAVLAHEYYGHYLHHPSEYPPGDWRDEFRASYMAAVNAPNLSDEDRMYLMMDAYDRKKEAGVFDGYDETARRIIYGY